VKSGTTPRAADAAALHVRIPAVEADAGETRTRQAVVHALLADGPLTAAALAERLGLTAAGVRRHLDQLLAEGAVATREAVSPHGRGRGRPARAYLLTEIGRSRLPHAYDALAVQALEFLADTAGPDAVTAFARRRAEDIVASVRDQLDTAAGIHERVAILSQALTAGGFAASVEKVGVGEQLCQHHCPVASVAARFPQLCEAEFAVLADAVGSYAQRLATIARGDSFCTTFIPVAAVGNAGLSVRADTAAPLEKSPAGASVPVPRNTPGPAAAPVQHHHHRDQGRTTS
jgi:predicted ArsR family transcriptional regulator